MATQPTAAPAELAAAVPEPTEGGSYTRDPVTHRLTRNAPPLEAAATPIATTATTPAPTPLAQE